VNFEIQDNGDATFTVFGVDSAGNGGIDISGIATMTAVSSDTSKLTVDAPVGVTSAIHAVGPLAPAPGVTVSIVVTFTSGSPAPISIDQPITIVQGPVSGVQVVFGTPTAH
jgi:hypothetical protein